MRYRKPRFASLGPLAVLRSYTPPPPCRLGELMSRFTPAFGRGMLLPSAGLTTTAIGSSASLPSVPCRCRR